VEITNIQNRRERFFRYAPLILWIGVVLFLSTGQASMSQTSRIVRPILEFLFPNTPEETLIIYHAFIRKCAHFTEYAVLAFWAARAFGGSSRNVLRKYWFIFSFLLVFSVASIDETNQSFNSARTGSQWDVLLDVSGGSAMILMLALYKTFMRKRSQ
jgi:VanZ family protein